MVNEAKKTIFFPIEHKHREFIPKLFLANELAKKNFRVYIGTIDNIDRAMQKAKPSIYFHKSTYIAKSEGIKKLGHKFVFLDEEGGITIPRSSVNSFCQKRYQVVEKKNTDFVFLPSLQFESQINNLGYLKDVASKVTGWPRVDLWDKKYDLLFSEHIQIIKKKYGEYYLFISSFGMTSEETFKRRIETSTTDFQIAMRTNKYNAFNNYIELLKGLSNVLNKDEKIIIRPHPSESIDDWNKITSDLPNVLVIREGDISPWILAADSIIQFNSTSITQAALHGIPSIQYKIDWKKGITDSATFELSYNAETVEEVYALLQKYRGQKDEEVKHKAIALLTEEMAYDNNEQAVSKIVKVLESFQVEKNNKLKLKLFDYLSPIIHHFRQLYIFINNKYFPKSGNLKRTRIEKIPNGIRKNEAITLLRKLAKTEGEDYCRNVDQVCKDLICIE